MKSLVAMAALAAAVALVLPAEAASSKRQKSVQASRPATVAPPVRPRLQAPHPHDVVLPNGEVVGRDPDPFIRLMIMRDPKPWEHTS